MIKVGDRLVCTQGNDLYLEGAIYTVGDFVNDKYFQILIGYDDEHWYATVNDKGIYVRFSSKEAGYSDAWFVEINNDNSDQNKLNIINFKPNNYYGLRDEDLVS